MADPDDEGEENENPNEEDWFERALEEGKRELDASEERPRATVETEEGEEVEQAPSQGEDPENGAEPDPDADTDGPDEFGFESGPDATDEEFETDFSEAFDGSDSGEERQESPLGEEGSVDFGGGAGEDESFGFDLGGGGTADTDFDDADLDSDLPRIDLGIRGLDEMIQGGVPERTLLVAIGGAGTGKTTFGLQFLNEALTNGERAVYISLEESHDRILQSAAEKGWDFEGYEAEGDLAIVDLDPIDMANSLTSIRNELPRLVESFGASRLVLDSVSLLEMMYDKQSTRRTEIYDFARALKAAGVTTMLTSEADADNPFASRYGIIEYLTDAVFVLRHVRPQDFRETRLAIEIQKIRDANHSRETKPYEITDTGISVYRQANIF